MRSPEDELSALREASLLRRTRPLESPQGTSVIRGGRALLNFSSNDYLGLATSDVLKEAARDAISKFGTGSGASRLLCGSLPPHQELEEEIAALKGTDAALTFSTGYAAAVGTLGALLGKNDIVIIDKLCHACLVDGARLSGATLRVFPHNHTKKLRHLLAWAREKAGRGGRVLVATESVFSMDGDRAPLQKIVTLTKEHDALLLVDEAHAFGIIGEKGAGLASGLDLSQNIDLHMGTFSKAAGVAGGYLCASRPLIDLITNRARSLIYSTAPPPATAATASAAVRLIASTKGDQLRNALWTNIRKLSPAAESAIVPHIIGDEEAALQASAQLENNGLLIPAVRYPTVARGTARLRITVSAAHTEDAILRLAEALKTLEHF